MSTVVRVQGLTKSFKEVQAVKGISFDVAKGEVFGLVGPDGAGKTTAMRILAAILAPDRGSAEILGMDTTSSREKIHDRIAYMSQRFGLYQDLTVEENIRFYADMYGVEKKQQESGIKKLLNWSSLTQFRKRPAGKLSGGMKQKLGLACALVHTPELLLLDEPTNGVDPVSRKEFWNLLYKLVDEGLTIIMTTAYLDEAERCHRLAFMNKGEITARGTPGEIVRLIPGGVYKFKSDNPFEESNLVSSKTGAVSTVFGSQVHVMGDVTEQDIQTTVGRSVQISKTQGSVEDAFVYLSETVYDR
ncbi:ABC transporter ATP-binding protein [Candidatus Fermentibacteria bacterium]|nr:MAG: ABC transporter ATP-binding protein [Candidatus Fermentibacteria bacterium]